MRTKYTKEGRKEKSRKNFDGTENDEEKQIIVVRRGCAYVMCVVNNKTRYYD